MKQTHEQTHEPTHEIETPDGPGTQELNGLVIEALDAFAYVWEMYSHANQNGEVAVTDEQQTAWANEVLHSEKLLTNEQRRMLGELMKAVGIDPMFVRAYLSVRMSLQKMKLTALAFAEMGY